jgi:hypothetical protein
MRIALYSEEHRDQIILTPESNSEKLILEKLHDSKLTVLRGEFYACRGGWTREGLGETSTILVLEVPDA